MSSAVTLYRSGKCDSAASTSTPGPCVKMKDPSVFDFFVWFALDGNAGVPAFNVACWFFLTIVLRLGSNFSPLEATISAIETCRAVTRSAFVLLNSSPDRRLDGLAWAASS